MVKPQQDREDTARLFKRATVPIRWTLHPHKCLDSSHALAQITDCGWAPKQFILPLGGTGQIHVAGNPTRCLSVNGTEINSTALVVSACGDGLDSRTRFVVPDGGTGPVRWELYPNRCWTVRGGAPIGHGLELGNCTREDLSQRFGVAEEANPPSLPCASAGECRLVKEHRRALFCSQHPTWPQCRQLTRCPPGGCGNGACVQGYCQCNTGFSGPTCANVVPGPEPLVVPDAGYSTPEAIITFAPAPGPANVVAHSPAPWPGLPHAEAHASPHPPVLALAPAAAVSPAPAAH